MKNFIVAIRRENLFILDKICDDRNSLDPNILDLGLICHWFTCARNNYNLAIPMSSDAFSRALGRGSEATGRSKAKAGVDWSR